MKNLIKATENGNKNFKIQSDFYSSHHFSGSYGAMIDKLLELKKDAMLSGWATSAISEDTFSIIHANGGHGDSIVGYVSITTL